MFWDHQNHRGQQGSILSFPRSVHSVVREKKGNLQEVPGWRYRRGPSDAQVSRIVMERGTSNSGELSTMVCSMYVGGI